MPQTQTNPLHGNVLLDAQTRQPIALSMQHLHLSGQVSPAGALLRSTHRFKCSTDKPMEALYVFMLPRNGTLRRFVVKGEGFEIESKLSPREDARKEYEQGVDNGHLSVLAETASDGLVTLSVGQVRPDEEITVIVDAISGVDVKDDSFRFRFPFTLAPSYHAQAKVTSNGKLELPEDIFGDILLPDWKVGTEGLHQISFQMKMEPGGTLGTVSSPSHRISVTPNDDGSATVEMASDMETPNRDLVIDVSAREALPTLFVDKSVDKKIPKRAPHWTAVVPSSAIPKAMSVPRRVCFLVDTSGSMRGLPLDRAKAALDAMLAGLDPKDEFGLVRFGSSTDAFDKKMAPATEANRLLARKWLGALGANGGTQLARGLGEAVEVLGGPGGDIFLMTDGEVFGTGPIIEQASAAGSRIHVLGIGAASQDRFMASLARRTGGVSEMVGVREDVASASLKLFSAVQQPVQVGVTAAIGMGGKKKGQTQDIGTVWGGKAILLTDNGETNLNRPKTITFKWDGGSTKVDISQVFETPAGLPALLWAGGRIEDLESTRDMGLGGPVEKAAERDLREISTSYGLASRVMSLCAVVERIGDQKGEEIQQQIVPVGMPEDMAQGAVSLSGRLASRGISTCCFAASDPSFGSEPLIGCADYSVKSFSPSRGVSNVRGHYQSPVRGVGFGEGSELAPPGVETPTAWVREHRVGSFDLYERAANSRTLISSVALLMEDGGMPGKDEETRLATTVLLALSCLVTGELFAHHLRRMADYIEKSGRFPMVVEAIRKQSPNKAETWVDLFRKVSDGHLTETDALQKITASF